MDYTDITLRLNEGEKITLELEQLNGFLDYLIDNYHNYHKYHLEDEDDGFIADLESQLRGVTKCGASEVIVACHQMSPSELLIQPANYTNTKTLTH
nr:MAG TPA: hypothetical protein [Caudoviricetes sp.]